MTLTYLVLIEGVLAADNHKQATSQPMENLSLRNVLLFPEVAPRDYLLPWIHINENVYTMALIKRESLFHQTKLNVLSIWFSLSELPKSIINLQLESHFLSSVEEVSLSRLFSSQRWWLIWVCVRDWIWQLRPSKPLSKYCWRGDLSS